MTVRELPIVELARRCREETLRFLSGNERDDRFALCFHELALAQTGKSAMAFD